MTCAFIRVFCWAFRVIEAVMEQPLLLHVACEQIIQGALASSHQKGAASFLNENISSMDMESFFYACMHHSSSLVCREMAVF